MAQFWICGLTASATIAEHAVPHSSDSTVTAANAAFALKAGLWVRRFRFVTGSPVRQPISAAFRHKLH